MKTVTIDGVEYERISELEWRQDGARYDNTCFYRPIPKTMTLEKELEAEPPQGW